VSRAPLAKLQAFKRRMGWTFPWASSSGSDFNADFNVWFTPEQQRAGIEYNYRRRRPLRRRLQGRAGRGIGRRRQFRLADRCNSGHQCHHVHARLAGPERVRTRDGVVYHTYSSYARGLDGLWGMYQWSIARRSTQRTRLLVAPP